MSDKMNDDRWTFAVRVEQVMVNDPAVNRAPVEIYGVTEPHQAEITFLCYEGEPSKSHIQYWVPEGQTAQYVAHVYLSEEDLRRHGDRLVSAAAPCTVSITYELGKALPTDRTKEALYAFRVGYVRRC